MNEITLYEKMPDPLAAVERMGTMIAKSGMFGIDNINAGCVIALICMSEGMSLMEYHRVYDTVLGKPRKKALASFAEFRQRGGKVKWLNDGDEGKFASAKFKFEDQTLVHTFTIDQAVAAGLVKKDSAWQKSVGNMLRARCLSNGIAMLCPEIFAGADEENSKPAPAAEIKLEPENTGQVAGRFQRQTTIEVEPAKPVEKPKGVTPHDTTQSSPQAPPTPSLENYDATQPNASGAVSPPEKVAGASVANPPAASLPAQKQAPTAAPAGDTLPPETVQKLETIIGADGPKATKWFLAQNPPWLQPGQGLEFLAENKAANIIRKAKDFLNAINR